MLTGLIVERGGDIPFPIRAKARRSDAMTPGLRDERTKGGKHLKGAYIVNLRNINLELKNFTNGGPVILQEVAASHPYRDGKRIMDEIDGRKITVVFPENKYDTLTVTVSDPTDALTPLLAKATAANPVYVDFDGFTATVYAMRGSDGRFSYRGFR